jgi:predicted nucleic acid-binding protein
VKPDDVPDGPVLVDTDVSTWILTGAANLDSFKPYLKDRVLAISFATLGELLALAYRTGSPWGEPKRDRWREQIRQTFVGLPYDIRVAETWAPLHMKLKGQLGAGGANDLWTAATALSQAPALPVVTNNHKHFDAIAVEAPALLVVHP